MTTSKPSQAPLFAIGSDEPPRRPTAHWPTPDARDSQPEGFEAGLRRLAKDRTLGLQTAVRIDSTSSPEAIPANPSRSPGSDWARRMTAISGRGLRRWLPTSGLGVVFSRMSTDTSRWGSTRCWLTWSRSVTPAGRSLFRLRPSAPRTGEIASGFWPTPDAGMTQGGRALPPGTTPTGKTPDGRKVQVGLTNAVNGKLSAAWVTRLMGYPDGYLDLTEDE